MAATLKSRKPIDLLTVEDLGTFPIWEYCLDEEDVPEQDETWVRPVKNRCIPRGGYSLTVAADFTTSGTQTFRGFVQVTTVEKQVEVCQGVILDGHEPYLVVPSTEFGGNLRTKAELSAGLGLPESKVFPIGYKLRVPVVGESNCRSGQFV